MNHSSAVDYCKTKEGKLFEPKSEQENDAVSAIAEAKGMSRFWIGNI